MIFYFWLVMVSNLVMESIWSENGGPDPRHFVFVVYLTLFFFLARFLLDHLIFKRLATWLLTGRVTPVKISRAKRRTIIKCSESMWKFAYYATVQAWVLTIAYHESWFTDTKEYFSGWPNQELKFPLKLLYMCQCGFYVYSIVALITWETRRKDFSVMMSHHVISVILIGYSYLTSFFRIGAVVLALHDTSDVFMEAAKIFKYSGKEFTASVLFGFFAVTWFILRLVIFPFWVIKTASYDLCEVLRVSGLSETSNQFLYYIFNTMLLILLIFHIYWWILICSMIMRQLNNKGKVGEDIRSDSDGENM